MSSNRGCVTFWPTIKMSKCIVCCLFPQKVPASFFCENTSKVNSNEKKTYSPIFILKFIVIGCEIKGGQVSTSFLLEFELGGVFVT